MDQAVDWLKKKGLSQMAKRASKEASEGLIASYVHTGSRIGTLVEVNTETDFSARSEAFQKFVKNLTLHITAMNPSYVSIEEIPESHIQKQTELFQSKALEQGKSGSVLKKIVEGQIEKWKKEVCLLDQEFVCPDVDESRNMTVREALAELTTQVREKMVIRRFVRYELGQSDYPHE